MILKHIYITKEGEPMANPEMEYPDKLRGDSAIWEGEERAKMVNKYHSGLLPFEDRDGIRMILGHQSNTFEESQEWKFKPGTLIPVDLEVEVVVDAETGALLLRIKN